MLTNKTIAIIGTRCRTTIVRKVSEQQLKEFGEQNNVAVFEIDLHDADDATRALESVVLQMHRFKVDVDAEHEYMRRKKRKCFCC
jgi:hypothetical protein